MGTETQSKMLNLLDQAYQVTDDFDHLDALLDSASSYLFEDQQNAVVAKGLPHFAELDPFLETHINRLENLLAQHMGDEKQGLTLGNHAQFVLDRTGRVITANEQARALLSGGAGAFFDALPLSPDSMVVIRDLVREIAAGVQGLERIIYLQIGAEDLHSAFGYCRAIPIDADNTGLHISLSYFDWSPAIFHNLQNALDLSDSEGLVLEGVLQGLSHQQIAQSRGRSINTIKTQIKAILRKAGCSKMNELVHLCTSIAYVIGLTDIEAPTGQVSQDWVTPKQGLQTLALEGGRTLSYYEYGDPSGRPILYWHGFFQGAYFPDTMKRDLLRGGFRLIAPSRPYFGYTSGPDENHDFDTTTCQDALALVEELGLGERLLIVAHHGGVSHAFRFAHMIENRLSGMVMVGAGIPLTPEHIRFMTKQARMTSTASRHAPSVLKLIATMGIKTYRKKGIDAFMNTHYAPAPLDHKSLDDSAILSKLHQGMFHLVEQGADAFVHDGRSQLADWTSDFKAVNCRQSWISGRHCHLMGAHFVEEFVTSNTNHPVEIVEDAGYNVLYQCPERIMDKIREASDWD